MVPRSLIVAMSWGLVATSHAGVDDDQVLPCRPTFACTADLAPPGTLELELGGQPRDPSGSSLVTTVPFLLKLPVAHWLELQVSSNGFTYSSPAERYFDNVVLGAKVHFADQTAHHPSLAITASAGIPNAPQRGYVRAYDAELVGAASKDIGNVHFDLNIGVEVFQVDGPRAAQPFAALAATYAVTRKVSIAFEPHYFAAASAFATRDVGAMGAIEYAARSWLVFDSAIDVTLLEPRAVMGLFGVSIAPVRLWGD